MITLSGITLHLNWWTDDLVKIFSNTVSNLPRYSNTKFKKLDFAVSYNTVTAEINSAVSCIPQCPTPSSHALHKVCLRGWLPTVNLGSDSLVCVNILSNSNIHFRQNHYKLFLSIYQGPRLVRSMLTNICWKSRDTLPLSHFYMKISFTLNCFFRKRDQTNAFK